MNTKERLIEAFNKNDDWYIDLYRSGDSFIELLYLLEDINDFTWSNGNHLCELSSFSVPRIVYGNKYRELYKLYEIHLSDKEGKTDLTQLFNEYLEKYEPKIWMHSLLAAHHLGLKIERYTQERSLPVWTKWITADTSVFVIDTSERYRIDFESEPETMVPDEIWNMLNDYIKYIAADGNGDIYAFENEPIRTSVVHGWRNNGNIFMDISHFKIMQNAKIRDIDWKDSLCVRPTK